MRELCFRIRTVLNDNKVLSEALRVGNGNGTVKFFEDEEV